MEFQEESKSRVCTAKHPTDPQPSTLRIWPFSSKHILHSSDISLERLMALCLCFSPCRCPQIGDHQCVRTGASAATKRPSIFTELPQIRFVFLYRAFPFWLFGEQHCNWGLQLVSGRLFVHPHPGLIDFWVETLPPALVAWLSSQAGNPRRHFHQRGYA